jgi:hypothetical protein
LICGSFPERAFLLGTAFRLERLKRVGCSNGPVRQTFALSIARVEFANSFAERVIRTWAVWQPIFNAGSYCICQRKRDTVPIPVDTAVADRTYNHDHPVVVEATGMVVVVVLVAATDDRLGDDAAVVVADRGAMSRSQSRRLMRMARFHYWNLLAFSRCTQTVTGFYGTPIAITRESEPIHLCQAQ